MLTRSRFALAFFAALLAVAVIVPSATAKAKPVPKVTGLAALGSNTVTAKLAVKWKKVTGATYQVRWAYSKAKLGSATVYPSKAASASSPTLSNICITWYAQVRAKKGTKYGAWSTAKALKFTVPSIHVPTPITTGQTSSSQAQVRWARAAGVAGYRLDYSPAPYLQWVGLEHLFTPWTAPSATGATINLPAVGAGDHFLGAAYGNPTYAQLDVKRCNGTTNHSAYFPIYPKAFDPGCSATGNALRFGSYNVELVPQTGDPDIAALAENIKDAALDVLALQEANSGTTSALITQLTADGQADWEAYTVGQQAVMYRTSEWTNVESFDIGQPVDGVAGTPSDGAKTPLPTPAVHLTPAGVPDPTRQDIFVASVHLEDRGKFYPLTGHPGQCNCTIAERKQDAHDAALSLLASMDADNVAAIPELVAGDFKGNFGGSGQPTTYGNCDESSTPPCVGEGQPTFIRASPGFFDARGAATRVGAEYGTVNGHAGTQSRSNSGVGGRADYILVRGFSGVSRYVNLDNKTFPGLIAADNGTPSDHNLIYADLFIPHAS